MKQKILVFTFLLLFAAVLNGTNAACAEEAQDITEKCKISVSQYSAYKKNMFDHSNMTMWETDKYGGHIEVTAPEKTPACGVYIQWGYDALDVVIQVPGEKPDSWVDYKLCDEGYYNQYIAFDDPLVHFRVKTVQKDVCMGVIKFQVLSGGTLPEWVQTWVPFEGKADLMVLVAHADDELLYMGGVIPYYQMVEGKKVIVVYIANMNGFRKVELLNGLWHCGVRNYPEAPGKEFIDVSTGTLEDFLRIWEEDKLLSHVSEMIRKYQPDVIVTHDVEGEYGHGAHKACCYAVQRCIELAADAEYDPASAEEYGAWQVKKAYIHLYKGKLGQIDFDWRQPMEAFDGKTILQVTEEAFRLHKSQAVAGKYTVQDYGQYDNSLFGLYFSTVGADTGMNDLFENID